MLDAQVIYQAVGTSMSDIHEQPDVSLEMFGDQLAAPNQDRNDGPKTSSYHWAIVRRNLAKIAGTKAKKGFSISDVVKVLLFAYFPYVLVIVYNCFFDRQRMRLKQQRF